MTAIVGLTRWTPTDDAAVIAATDYISVTRDPSGTIIIPAAGKHWPEPQRAIGSFTLTYECGWEVTASENAVPLSIQLMVSRAVEFRHGAGLGDISIGSLKLSVADSYSTDKLPKKSPVSGAPGPTDRACSLAGHKRISNETATDCHALIRSRLDTGWRTG